MKENSSATKLRYITLAQRAQRCPCLPGCPSAHPTIISVLGAFVFEASRGVTYREQQRKLDQLQYLHQRGLSHSSLRSNP